MKRLEYIELPGHIALMALGQSWMTDAHIADLITACCLAKDISTDSNITSLAQRGLDMIALKDTRHDEMKHVIGTVLQWLSTQPNSKIYHATIKRLQQHDEQAKLS